MLCYIGGNEVTTLGTVDYKIIKDYRIYIIFVYHYNKQHDFLEVGYIVSSSWLKQKLSMREWTGSRSKAALV